MGITVFILCWVILFIVLSFLYIIINYKDKLYLAKNETKHVQSWGDGIWKERNILIEHYASCRAVLIALVAWRDDPDRPYLPKSIVDEARACLNQSNQKK